MKKVVSGLAIMLAFVIFIIIWNNYVFGISAAIEQGIEDAIALLQEDKQEEGYQKVHETRELWDETEDILSLFLSHTITENVDINFERALTMVEYDEIPHAITELRAIHHSLLDMKNAMRLSLRNVF